MSTAAREIPCAGALVFDANRRILLIKRGREPARGYWSVPGGKCESGESAESCCVRETHEETGLDVRVLRFVGRVARSAPDGGIFVIDDFECVLLDDVNPDDARAGDDAVEVGWFAAHDLTSLPLVDGLVAVLAEWSLLPD